MASAPKRKAAEITDFYSPNDDVTQEYLCPITQELPLEPCTAEDGHCYDKWAFEKWAKTKQEGELKSPMTNQPMGTKLYPAVQVRNAIERLIKKGIIAGEGARLWKEKQDEMASMTTEMRETMAKAHQGEVEPMRRVGFAYRDGTNGVKKNEVVALKWFSQAAKHDDPFSIVSIGIFYLNGTAVKVNLTEAMLWLTRAAMLGSEHAGITIGHYYSGQLQNQACIENDEHAEYWYRKSLNDVKHKDSVAESREMRDKWLAKHGGGRGEVSDW